METKDLILQEKLKKLDSHFKKQKPLVELYLEKYEKCNVYIRIDYIKKYDTYQIRWYDLDFLDIKKLDSLFGYETVYREDLNYYVNLIKKDLKNITKIEEKEEKTDIFHMYISDNLTNDKEINIRLNKYVPVYLKALADFIVYIFNNIPRKFEPFLFKLMAELDGTTNRYEIKKSIKFNLYKDYLDKLFSREVIVRGENYFSRGKVIFLEKINDRYIAVVEGSKKYVVFIKYDEKNKTMEMSCNCPSDFYCKHLCAVIIAIREKKIKKFYKISFIKNEKDMLEKITEFNYYLCIGIKNEKFEIIDDYGNIAYADIYNDNHKTNWKIIEDSKDKKLNKMLEEVI